MIRFKLKMLGPGANRSNFPELDVKLLKSACAEYKSFIDALLSHLNEKKELPVWLDRAKGDGTLFLFSKDPRNGNRQPINIINIKKEWDGQYWGGEDGKLSQKHGKKDGKKDVKALQTYLEPRDSCLYIAKVCPQCIAPDSTTLKILTAQQLFGGKMCGKMCSKKCKSHIYTHAHTRTHTHTHTHTLTLCVRIVQ